MSLSSLPELRAREGASIWKQRGKRSPEETEEARLQVESSASMRLTVDFAKCRGHLLGFCLDIGLAKLNNIYFFSLFHFFLFCLFVFSFDKCSKRLHSRQRNVFTNKIVHELYKLWQGEAACSKGTLSRRILSALTLCHTGTWVWKAESTVCHRKPNAALKPSTWQPSPQPSILHFLAREMTAEHRLTPCWVKALICLHWFNSSSADPVWHGCHPPARSNPDCRWAAIAATQQGAVWDKGLTEGLRVPNKQDAHPRTGWRAGQCCALDVTTESCRYQGTVPSAL